MRRVRATPRSRVRALATALFLLTAASGLADEPLKAGVFDPPRAAPDFSLDGSNGAKVSIAQQRGKVVILEFGFTYCQNVCPRTLAQLVKVFERLGPDAAKVQLVYVTVDPKRDNPKRLREYLEYFNPAFIGATGTEAELDAVRQAYGVEAKQVVSANKQLGYEVHHTSTLFLIDPEGKLRALAPFGMSADDIAHDVRSLVKGSAPH